MDNPVRCRVTLLPCIPHNICHQYPLFNLQTDQHFSWLVEPVSGVGPVLGMVTDHHWAERWSILNRKLCSMIKAKTFLRVPSVATWYFSFKKMFSFFRSPFILKHWDMYLALKVKMLLLNYWLIAFVIVILTQNRCEIVYRFRSSQYLKNILLISIP